MAPISPATIENSLLHIERISQYVSLSPGSLNNPLPSLCASIFSPLLLTYFPPARGIVLAYQDVHLSAQPPIDNSAKSQGPEPLLLKHVDEYAAPFLWATASFLVLRLQRGKCFMGVLTHQTSTHVVVSLWNVFSVSVTAAHLPDTWTWRDGRAKSGDGVGSWVDGDGAVVGGEVEVCIRGFEGRVEGRAAGKGFLKIEGSLVAEGEGRERERERGKRGK